METGSHCPSRCVDCYVPVRDRKNNIKLSQENIDDIIDTAYRIGVNYLTQLGGEPFDDSIVDTNLKMIRENPGIRFTACTSGYGLDNPEVMNELKKYSNIIPAFSIDGPKEINDKIRGTGSFEKLTTTLRDFSEGGKSLSGIITTLRPENWEAVTDIDFIKPLCDLGSYFFEFGPYYSTEDSHRMTPEQYAQAVLNLTELSRQLPAVIFSNNFGQVFGKKMNIKKRIHAINIDYNGNVYHSRRGHIFGNINETPLMDILTSPEFQDIFIRKHKGIDPNSSFDSDPRYKFLFQQTFDLLEESGIDIIK